MRFLTAVLDKALARAEREIALFERCRPMNSVAEQARVLTAWNSGHEVAPSFVYGKPPDFTGLRRELDRLAKAARAAGSWGRLYAQRAEELLCEAVAAEALGEPDFASRAAQRYVIDAEEGRVALAWAGAWCASADASRPADAGDLHYSDDERDPASLVSSLRRTIDTLRLPVRVTVSPDLVSAAATADAVIFVRTGLLHSQRQVKRIVVHEIEGHALPRLRARSESLGLFRVGTARGLDDEEGRALLLEARVGCFDRARRAELAWRHLAAMSVRNAATWMDTVRLLLDLGTPTSQAVNLASRVHRGGGLGREVVYLTALCRVGHAFERDPTLESWLERGRIGVQAARTLRQLGDPPEHLDTDEAA